MAQNSHSTSLDTVTAVAKNAKAAFEASQLIGPSERVKALYLLVEELKTSKSEIHEANKLDLEVITITLH